MNESAAAIRPTAYAHTAKADGGADAASQASLPTQRLSYIAFKRCFDVPAAIVGLILLSPVFLTIWVAIRLASPGPVIFRQMRVGRGGELFPCFKFRTMRTDAEEVLKRDPELYRRWVENDFKLPEGEDPRVTSIGRILRKTSLDELPQLFNVIRGEMSLVGPRPVIPAELEHYAGREAAFLSALPGMTGQWQVGGRSALQYPERAGLELSYVSGWSPLLDLRILLKTVGVVLGGRGAF